MKYIKLLTTSLSPAGRWRVTGWQASSETSSNSVIKTAWLICRDWWWWWWWRMWRSLKISSSTIWSGCRHLSQVLCPLKSLGSSKIRSRREEKIVGRVNDCALPEVSWQGFVETLGSCRRRFNTKAKQHTRCRKLVRKKIVDPPLRGMIVWYFWLTDN